jgi:hypothetical protein
VERGSGRFTTGRKRAGIRQGRGEVLGDDSAVVLDVMNPRGEILPPQTVAPTPRLNDLAGKTIGLYWNGKAGADNLLDALEVLLRERFPATKIRRYEGPLDVGETLAADLSEQTDTFVYGVGD